MAARLHLERAQAASQTLAALGLAALVLDEFGKVLAANALIEGLVDLVQWRVADRATLMDRRADALLAEALARIAVNDNGGVRSFPVRDPSTEEPMVGHVVPIRFSARDIFARSAAVFVLMPVAAPSSPPVELVMSLFDLTPAEARVARGLAAGRTVDDLAGDNGVSPNTVARRSAGCSRRPAASARRTSCPCWAGSRRCGSRARSGPRFLGARTRSPVTGTPRHGLAALESTSFDLP